MADEVHVKMAAKIILMLALCDKLLGCCRDCMACLPCSLTIHCVEPRLDSDCELLVLTCFKWHFEVTLLEFQRDVWCKKARFVGCQVTEKS